MTNHGRKLSSICSFAPFSVVPESVIAVSMKPIGQVRPLVSPIRPYSLYSVALILTDIMNEYFAHHNEVVNSQIESIDTSSIGSPYSFTMSTNAKGMDKIPVSVTLGIFSMSLLQIKSRGELLFKATVTWKFQISGVKIMRS